MVGPIDYKRSLKYADLEAIYAQCSGPGGLKLAELIANKLSAKPGDLLLDIGTYSGAQTCFLAKEYGVFAVGIDPGKQYVEQLMHNAQSWGVQGHVLGVCLGVPDTRFADNSFDIVYSTTTFEMIRGSRGEDEYRKCLSEVHRILRPGGLFGYGDPMHLDVAIPPDLLPLVGGDWVDCFVTLEQTVEAFRTVGFQVVDAAYVPDAQLWWEEYSQFDPGCRANPDGDARTIRVDGGRWLSYGYVIAKKPS